MTTVTNQGSTHTPLQTLEFKDPEQIEFEHKMAKTIQEMPEDVRDRFKAIFVLHVSIY